MYVMSDALYRIGRRIPEREVGFDPHSGRRVVSLSKTHSRARSQRTVFLWQSPIVTETMTKFLGLHIARKSVKETMSRNLC